MLHTFKQLHDNRASWFLPLRSSVRMPFYRQENVFGHILINDRSWNSFGCEARKAEWKSEQVLPITLVDVVTYR